MFFKSLHPFETTFRRVYTIPNKHENVRERIHPFESTVCWSTNWEQHGFEQASREGAVLPQPAFPECRSAMDASGPMLPDWEYQNPGEKSGLGQAPAAEWLDLLTEPLEAARPYPWKHFSEQPQTRLSEVWQLREGVLSCQGTPKGYLYLDHDFTDFVLRLEWRWPEGAKPGNGGVLFRIEGPDKIWPRSLEAQINAGQAGDFWGLGGFALAGPPDRMKTAEHAQFGRLTHLKRAADLEKPPGQWNEYEIIARGPTVTLRINGQEVNRATGCDTRAGRICLTAEGDAIQFRNLRLQPVAAATGPSAPEAEPGTR